MHEPSTSSENLASTQVILQTSSLEENRFDQEHVKQLTLRNIGTFE